MTVSLFDPLSLPNGQVLPNRLAKAAMEERMATRAQLPGKELRTLYRRWSEGGAGLIITGNVMVHDAALTGPGGVVLDANSPLEPFTEWARAGQAGGSRIWMQINHPGRQVMANMPGVAWAPSAVRANIGRNTKRLAEPVAMTGEQIEETIQRFITTAMLAEEAGFDGLEVHAAHGYLLSQFLSPLSNLRTDEWGGSLDNRARLLVEIVRGIRSAVRPSTALAVKLNSADFQRGGFDAEDARRVIDMLAPLGVDLVELSGGNYESPAMTGQRGGSPSDALAGSHSGEERGRDARTRAREAYFLDLAESLARTSPIPLMLTGGIVRRSVAEQALAAGIDVIGMGTALAEEPNLPNDWRSSEKVVEVTPVTFQDKATASVATMARVRHQLHRLGAGKSAGREIGPRYALLRELLNNAVALHRYKKWLARREPVRTEAMAR
ncbi:NADH:flavin oxidoreductase/NADH oxidase family protein [Haematomicrobium sanguinis]|uniref:NADH:flavin oxidoreductase/NADH oxidase family protein n=1 Tax=Haematomicrobium sanguinis TaxID=479106 RepID=UPI0004798CE9|nr:NADH:flavin oxidoreductase/NADH oxidase family protein [Haematomicrobium sanguinis]